MTKVYQLIYPMGKITISASKSGKQLEAALKNFRHFKPSEYLTYYKLPSDNPLIAEFPLFDDKDSSSPLFLKAYKELFLEANSNGKPVPFSNLHKHQDSTIFVVAARYWPIEFDNFPKVARIPMFLQAETMEELKLRILTFIRDFGHNKKSLEACKPFINLINLGLDSDQCNITTSPSKSSSSLDTLPDTIKPILYMKCASVSLMTSDGPVQVSDSTLERISQEIETHKLSLVVLSYDLDEGIKMKTERDFLLSECLPSVPFVMKQNEVIFVFTGYYLASRAHCGYAKDIGKKVAYKISKELSAKEIAKFLGVSTSVFEVSEEIHNISENRVVRVKVVKTREGFWKYDKAFYGMMLSNILGVQTTVSECLSLNQYLKDGQLLFAIILAATLAITITTRMTLSYMNKEFRWYTIFLSITGFDRMQDSWYRWEKVGNKLITTFNTENIQLYCQTVISLILSIVTQLMTNEINAVLLVNTVFASVSVCLTFTGMPSCLAPLNFDPKQNLWNTRHYGVMIERKYNQTLGLKIRQVTQIFFDIASRFLIYSVVLIKLPIVFGTLFLVYYTLENMYLFTVVGAPLISILVNSPAIAPAKTFAGRDILFVEILQIKHMITNNLHNPELLMLGNYFSAHLMGKMIRGVTTLVSIIYLLYGDNYETYNTACTYAVQIGLASTGIAWILFMCDLFALQWFAKKEKERKFAPLYPKESEKRTYKRVYPKEICDLES